VELPGALQPRTRVGTGPGHHLVDAVRLPGRDCQRGERRWSPSRVVPGAGLRVSVVQTTPRLVTASVAVLLMDDLGAPSDAITTYEVRGSLVWRLTAISVAMIVVIFGLTALAVGWHGRRSLEFCAVDLVVSAGLCYFPLWLWMWRLDLAPYALRWRGMIRRGTIPLEKVVRVRNDPKEPSRAVIETTTRKRLLIAIQPHMLAFARQIQIVAPHVEVNLTYNPPLFFSDRPVRPPR
jgi:hypothetical protein